MSNPAPISLEQLFKYWRALPHQLAAVQALQKDLAANGYDVAMRRDRPWFQTWSQDGKQADLTAAVSLIKEFEGCHLSAYPDPLSGGDPWTIGYGTTRYSGGVPVKRGDKITVIEADMLLRIEVDRIAGKLRTSVPHWKEMDDSQKSALVSFAYNLGSGFYGSDGFETISRCLREKAWDQVPKAMQLYRNPGSNVEAGLMRRRKAEGQLWSKGLPATPVATASLSIDAPFSAHLTPHITLGEFALREERRRFDRPDQVKVALYLANFLEKVRTTFGNQPIIITSGYRPPAINSAVGGASDSEHLYKPGCGAVDFYVSGANIKAVQDWCDKHWAHSLGYGAGKGFVHLGVRSGSSDPSKAPRIRWDY
jgi:GH24 family phage-related lysozyme (muramidase)